MYTTPHLRVEWAYLPCSLIDLTKKSHIKVRDRGTIMEIAREVLVRHNEVII